MFYDVPKDWFSTVPFSLYIDRSDHTSVYSDSPAGCYDGAHSIFAVIQPYDRAIYAVIRGLLLNCDNASNGYVVDSLSIGTFRSALKSKTRQCVFIGIVYIANL